MVSEDVPLDHRVHARIIGARGKAIRKIMDEFKVRLQPWGEVQALVLEAIRVRWVSFLQSEVPRGPPGLSFSAKAADNAHWPAGVWKGRPPQHSGACLSGGEAK